MTFRSQILTSLNIQNERTLRMPYLSIIFYFTIIYLHHDFKEHFLYHSFYKVNVFTPTEKFLSITMACVKYFLD
jgi:hypothetical protein